MRQRVFFALALVLILFISSGVSDIEVEAIGAVNDRTENIATLFDKLSSSDIEVYLQARRQILDALLPTNTEEIIQLATKHLSSNIPRVRASCISILGSVGGFHPENLALRQKIFYTLAPLVQQEKDEFPRQFLATALGQLAVEEAIPLLKQMSIESEPSRVWREVLRALGEIGREYYVDQITPFLLQELRSELDRLPRVNTGRPHAIIDALGRVDDRRVLEGLKLAFYFSYGGLRLSTVWALGMFISHNRYPEWRHPPKKLHRYSVSSADRAIAEAMIVEALSDADEIVRSSARSTLDRVAESDRKYAEYLKTKRTPDQK